MIRGIYAKILIWFWIAAIFTVAMVIVISNVSGSQPIENRWMSLDTTIICRTAVVAYVQFGQPALSRYMENIEHSRGVQAALLDPQDRDILGNGLPPHSEGMVDELRRTGKRQFRGGLTYTEAIELPTAQGTFVIITQVHPWRAFENPKFLSGMGLKLLIGLILTGALCIVIARHIAAPIRTLQEAAGRIADGDLSVRAMPAIGTRNDELADLARDFDRMAARIQELLEKQQELLGDISHELRSPLTRLNVSLELMRHGETDVIEHMQTDINRLENLIGEVLTLTRLHVREGQKTTTTVNLRSIVESVAEDARFEGKSEGKSVVVSQADDCRLSGDPALLRSCIENVVRNALRHTKPQTGVIITLNRIDRDAGSLAQVCVVDHGDGVPAESLSRLFEPFYRVSGAQASKNGTGLGLTIAQRVAQMYGGRISARNRDSGGLEMEIELPLLAGLAKANSGGQKT